MIAPFEFLMDRAVDHDIHMFFCHEVIIETPSFVQTTRIHPSVSEETKLLSLGVQVSKRVNEAQIKHPLKGFSLLFGETSCVIFSPWIVNIYFMMCNVEVSRNYHRFIKFRFHFEYMVLEVCIPLVHSIIESQ